MTAKEYTLIQKIISATNKGEEQNYKLLLTELIKSFDDNYKIKIINIIRSKYTLSHEEKNEAAKDLYSDALAIFLKNSLTYFILNGIHQGYKIKRESAST